MFRVPGNPDPIASALQRVSAFYGVGLKVLERREQKRPKSALIRRHATQRVFFDKMNKECLREIRGILMVASAPSRKRIQRIPIRLAQLGQRNPPYLGG